jgi:hypothetical protein
MGVSRSLAAGWLLTSVSQGFGFQHRTSNTQVRAGRAISTPNAQGFGAKPNPRFGHRLSVRGFLGGVSGEGSRVTVPKMAAVVKIGEKGDENGANCGKKSERIRANPSESEQIQVLCLFWENGGVFLVFVEILDSKCGKGSWRRKGESRKIKE